MMNLHAKWEKLLTGVQLLLSKAFNFICTERDAKGEPVLSTRINMTDNTNLESRSEDAIETKEPTAAEQRLSRRKALFGALIAGAATIKASEAAAAPGADCSCLPAPNCDSICPNGGAPRGDGTQACDCFDNPPLPQLATVAYTGKYDDLIGKPNGSDLDNIVGAGSAGPGGNVTLTQTNNKGTVTQAYKGSFSVPYFKVNSQGRITSYATRTVSLVENYYNYSNYYNYYFDYNCNDNE